MNMDDLLMMACTTVDDTLYECPTGEGNDIFGSFLMMRPL